MLFEISFYYWHIEDAIIEVSAFVYKIVTRTLIFILFYWIPFGK